MNFDMISLCKDKHLINSALSSIQGSVFIADNIRLYLDSYGTEYEFIQFYLQYSDEDSNITAAVMRYNNQVYAIVDNTANLDELAAFISGLEDCSVFADEVLKLYFNDYKTCYTFCREGAEPNDIPENINIEESAKCVVDLVAQDYDEESRLDFFLNTAHQMRHNLISVYGYYAENKLASVVSVSKSYDGVREITFVYTDEYFRGNGIAAKLLSAACCDVNDKYILLCEEHNVKFYEKCGFSQLSSCIEFHL